MLKFIVRGKTLDEVCPDHLRPRWEKACSKLRAFMKSFNLASVSLEENCFFDLVPHRFLLEYCYVKNEICKYVLRPILSL